MQKAAASLCLQLAVSAALAEQMKDEQERTASHPMAALPDCVTVLQVAA